MTKSSELSSKPSNRPTHWLITGGCGFIGTNLIKQLLFEDSYTIRVIDNLSVGSREDLATVCDFLELDLNSLSPLGLGGKSPVSSHSTSSPQVELIVGDILDDKLAVRATKGVDVIVHLAASTGVEPSVQDPRSDCITNITGTLNYLEAAKKNRIKRFIFASSGASIGDCEPPIHEELAPHPVSPYGASKLAGEAYCSAYFHTFGIETVALRFSNVYGPGSGQKDSVVAKFIKRAIHGEPFEIYGDGKQTRDFVFIDDLVQAILLGAKVGEIGGEIFQIATNRETTVVELVEKLLPVLANEGINNVEVSHGTPRKGDVLRNFSNTSKAKEVLGWEAKVEMSGGFGHTVKWFSDNSRKEDIRKRDNT